MYVSLENGKQPFPTSGGETGDHLLKNRSGYEDIDESLSAVKFKEQGRKYRPRIPCTHLKPCSLLFSQKLRTRVPPQVTSDRPGVESKGEKRKKNAIVRAVWNITLVWMSLSLTEDSKGGTVNNSSKGTANDTEVPGGGEILCPSVGGGADCRSELARR